MSRKGRKDKITLAWLYIGHIYLTHSYLLKNEDKPTCTTCQAALTVKHILIECTPLAPLRHKSYKETNIRKLFENTETINIMSYLKEIGLYQNITSTIDHLQTVYKTYIYPKNIKLWTKYL